MAVNFKNYINSPLIETNRLALLKEVGLEWNKIYNERKQLNLVFICTHNSRRSVFAEVWAQAAANYFGLKNVFCFSGGTEATSVHENAIKSLKRTGFSVSQLTHTNNPVFSISLNEIKLQQVVWSKLYNDDKNPQSNFIAVMVCASAEANCPFIPAAVKRISLTYSDPKEFDNLPITDEKYDERSVQIANEMFYLFSILKNA